MLLMRVVPLEKWTFDVLGTCEGFCWLRLVGVPGSWGFGWLVFYWLLGLSTVVALCTVVLVVVPAELHLATAQRLMLLIAILFRMLNEMCVLWLLERRMTLLLGEALTLMLGSVCRKLPSGLQVKVSTLVVAEDSEHGLLPPSCLLVREWMGL